MTDNVLQSKKDGDVAYDKDIKSGAIPNPPRTLPELAKNLYDTKILYDTSNNSYNSSGTAPLNSSAQTMQKPLSAPMSAPLQPVDMSFIRQSNTVPSVSPAVSSMATQQQLIVPQGAMQSSSMNAGNAMIYSQQYPSQNHPQNPLQPIIIQMPSPSAPQIYIVPYPVSSSSTGNPIGANESTLQLIQLIAQILKSSSPSDISMITSAPNFFSNPVASTNPAPLVDKAAVQTIFLDDLSKFFYLRDGVVLRSLPQLAYHLRAMSDEEFSYHVTNEKNDFANWVRDVFALPEFAEEISRIQSKNKLADFLMRTIF